MQTQLTDILKKALSQPTMWFFIVIITTFGLLSPQFLTGQNVINILIQSSSLTILAIGMTFVLLTAGIDLSLGSVMFLSAAIAGKLVVNTGYPVWLACAIVLVLGLVFGLVNGLLIHRLRLIPFVVTLATFYVGRGLGLLISQTRAINLPESFLVIGSAKVAGIPFPILIMILVTLTSHLFLTHTPFGRQIYAVGEDKEKALKAGIPVHKIIIGVYIICGFCAALGGFVAIAQLGAVSPTFGYQREFMAIAAAVLGGMSLFGGKGKIIPGTIIGAILIQTTESGLVMVNANPYFYPIITGGVLFVIVLIDSLHHKRQSVLKKLKPRL